MEGAASLMVGESGNNSRSTSGGGGGASRTASRMFRSILTCRVVKTNDAALRPGARRPREPLAGGRATAAGGPLATLSHNSNPNLYRKSKSTSGGKSSSKARDKVVPTIYKPVAGPTCSQCGKEFKPEKLHSHMKSCKSLKGARTKEDSIRMQSHEFSKEAPPCLFLTH